LEGAWRAGLSTVGGQLLDNRLSHHNAGIEAAGASPMTRHPEHYAIAAIVAASFALAAWALFWPAGL
jgi:hypothetical protein